ITLVCNKGDTLKAGLPMLSIQMNSKTKEVKSLVISSDDTNKATLTNKNGLSGSFVENESSAKVSVSLGRSGAAELNVTQTDNTRLYYKGTFKNNFFLNPAIMNAWKGTVKVFCGIMNSK
ncbi:MAG TPA: hypothetical protein VN132_04540, partial [Bdellovibrio sp.]|nr:hypothetical protein [Bdellovibrio sp.]